MQIHLSPRHLKLTASIHGYVAEKIGHLEELNEDILAAHVVLMHDQLKDPEKAYTVKLHLALPGPDLYAEDRESTLFAAIDKVQDKVVQQLRKRKTRLKEKTKHTLRRAAERKKSRG